MRASGVKMMNIAHLVAMMADSTSVTWCELANDAPGECEVIYRSKIHAVRGEISRMCNFGPSAPLGHLAVDLVGGGVPRADYGTQGPTQTKEQRPRDPPGPWDAGGR